MLAGNMQIARADFGWSNVESVQGAYVWSTYDTIVSAATAAGVQMLAILDRPPSWAMTSGIISPANFSDLINYCVAAVQHYSPMGVKYYEFFNEANISGNWQYFNYNTATYADLLKQIYQAIKGVDTTVTILHSGLAPVDGGDSTHQDSVVFLQNVYAEIGNGYFDAMNYHAYGWSKNQIAQIYATMAANGDEAKKIWFSEYGNYNGTAAGAVDLSTQALLAQQAIRNKRALPYAGPLIMYDFLDDGTDLTNDEDNYGVCFNDGRHKPQWSIIRDTIQNG